MTVLQSLDRYYGRMAARGEAEQPGWSREKISYVLVLTPHGMPLEMMDLRVRNGRKLASRMIAVPAGVKRTAGIAPNVFWDKTAYVFGRTAGEGRRTADEHAAFRAAHGKLLDGQPDAGLAALRLFLEAWRPERFDQAPFTPEMLDQNIIFRLDGDMGWLHEREAARRLLAATEAAGQSSQICLVTGMPGRVTRLHPSIKGVENAQMAGASLVSFNLDAFKSYGKEQGDNAPTSEAASFRYGEALNRMLDRGSPNRLARPMGDAALVFWADTSATVDEPAAAAADLLFASCFDPVPMADPDQDRAEAAKLARALQLVADGRAEEADLAMKPGTRFNVLGLAPNAARLSVRLWVQDDFSVFAQRLRAHYEALHIEPLPWRAKPPSIARLLVKTTALLEKFDNIPPSLAGDVARAVLTGGRYPRTWLSAAITRLRAGDNPGTGWHAAAIRAVLTRSEKEPGPVALTPDNPSPAYQLGRLFAVLEGAQRTALGRVNASIADRYYGAASATPARVFPPLLRGLRVHVSDARKRGLGGWIEPRVMEIMGRLPPDLPATLRLEDQGRFAIGYYHERAHRPAPAEIEPDPTDEES